MSTETPHGGHGRPPVPPPARKMPALNIELRGDRLYQSDHLNKWFAISSLLFFVFTVWMVLDDYNREWKRYQRQFNRMSIERTQLDMQNAADSLDRAKYQELQQQMDQTGAEQQQNEAQIRELQGRIDGLLAEQYRVNQDFQFSKSVYDADRYAYDEAVARQASNVDSLRLKMDSIQQEMNTRRQLLDQLTLDLRAANAELDKFIGRRTRIQEQMEAMLQEYNRLDTRLKTLNPGILITSFRNAPLLDFMAPSEKIDQVLLNDLFYDHPFKPVPRVDRCTTCHLGIDTKGFEEAPQPFRTHPRLEMFLASDSAHPKDQFGCTGCHGGLDRAVDFQTAGHTPRDPDQMRDWEEKYGWHEEHYLETPMLSLPKIEAGCYKCHNGTEVPQGNAINRGRDLVRTYGCFGCHKLPGYENVRKVGPDLTTISGKLTKEWVRKWIANPRAFKSEARMPQFWGNANNSGPQWDARNNAEMNAIVEYLFAKSKPGAMAARAARAAGNAAKGKELVESVGCYACHAIGPIQEVSNVTQHRRKFGYNLDAQGSKVSASWLVNWVKDPVTVWVDSKMPSLRLTDAEAADIAAYLASLKNAEFDKQAVSSVDPAALDVVTIELLKATMTEIEAKDRIQKMSAQEKNMFAGERLLARYGCFGCHNIEGFENAQPIGTELTQAGSKLITQLDFGFLDLPHTREAWYTQKLRNPRIFDVGRAKRPEEILRMPNFHFKDDDLVSVVMVLTSMVRDVVPLSKRDTPGPRTAAVEDGRALIATRNCRGCHIIEGAGGDIRATIAEQALVPPNLNNQGAKTQPLWLHPFLKAPTPLRPWLKVRMPTFHFDEKQAMTIGAYFSALDRVDYPFISTDVETTRELLGVGNNLFTQFQCAKCHPTSSGPPPPGVDPADLAPNLMISHERLRPEWILNWLLDPQKITPGTRMPSFFPDGVSPLPGVLGGDVRAQIRAIRDHVMVSLSGGKNRTVTLTNNN